MALGSWPRWLLFSVWLCVLFVSLNAHTPWRDEYQSWLVSTRTPELHSFFEAIRYERAPPLHYIIQRASANLIPGMLDWPAKVAVESVTVPFTILTVFFVIFGLGLSTLQGGLIAFSPYLFREFGLISRSYALGACLLLVAAYFARRKYLPLACLFLALGALTHLLFSWVCGALFVLLILKNRQILKSITVWLAGFILLLSAFLQLPPADSLFQSAPHVNLKTLFVALRGLNQALWGLEKIWRPYEWNTMPLATDLAVILIFPALFFIRRALSLKSFFWVCYPPVLLAASGSGMNIRSFGVSFLGFLVCFVLFKRELSSRRVDALTLFSGVACISTIFWWFSWAPYKAEPNFDFSGARQIVSDHKIKTGILLIEQDAPFFTWMAESKRSVFDMRRNRTLEYPMFKKSEYILANAEVWCAAYLSDFKKGHAGAIYMGFAKPRSFPPECGAHELVFENKHRILTDEIFLIYRLL